MGQTGRVAQRAATRRAIESAALELFQEKGFDGADVSEIAAKAGVSRRTFFRHFRQKADLLIGRGHEYENSLRDIIRRRPAREPSAHAVAHTMVAFGQWVESERGLMLSRAQIIMQNRELVRRALFVQALWADALADELAKRKGRERPCFEDQMLGYWGVGAHVTSVREWVRFEGQIPLHELTKLALGVRIRAPAALS
jgi:AcrR family transcriptional regulator